MIHSLRIFKVTTLYTFLMSESLFRTRDATFILAHNAFHIKVATFRMFIVGLHGTRHFKTFKVGIMSMVEGQKQSVRPQG